MSDLCERHSRRQCEECSEPEERRVSMCLDCKCMRECLKIRDGWVCPECIVQRIAEAEAAAYAGWVAATGYPIAEWVFEYHPFLKDYQPKEKETT